LAAKSVFKARWWTKQLFDRRFVRLRAVPPARSTELLRSSCDPTVRTTSSSNKKDVSMIRSARSGLLVVLVLSAVTLGVAACGGSSSPAAATSAAHHGAFGGRFAALSSCLKKHGVTLPNFGHGGGRPGTGHFRRPGAGFTPNPKLLAAMQDCRAALGGASGGGSYGGGFFGGGAPGAGGPPNGGPGGP
jgi:hypothetical protein